LFDTAVPSIAQLVLRSREILERFNLLLQSFLPLSRRCELMEYERDSRIRQTSLWRFLHDWVLDGLHQFISQSLRTIDIIQASSYTPSTLSSAARDFYETAVIAADRCQCAQTRLKSLAFNWSQITEVIELYSRHPIPLSEMKRSSIFGDFMLRLMSQPPVHTSPDDFKRLIELADQARVDCSDVYSTLEGIVRALWRLASQYRLKRLDADWAAKLDLDDLRERWTRLEDDIKRGKGIIMTTMESTLTLSHPIWDPAI